MHSENLPENRQLCAGMRAAGTQGSAIGGAACGLLFGVGTAISPLLIGAGCLGAISANIRRKLNNAMPWVQGMSMLFLVASGLSMITRL